MVAVTEDRPYYSDGERAARAEAGRHAQRKARALYELRTLINPSFGLTTTALMGAVDYIADIIKRCEDREDAARDNWAEAERLLERLKALGGEESDD